MAPSAAEALDSPGIWLEVSNVAQLVGKLPDSVQALPGLRSLSDVSSLASGALGADVGSVIDLSQPLDVAMPIPKGMASSVQVIAFRVRSPESIEHGEAGLTLRRLAPGMWQIGDEPLAQADAEEPPMDDDEEEEEEGADDDGEMSEEEQTPSRTPCVLAHAPPPVGYRVLCGSRLDVVQAVAPFLTRDLPRQDADLHLELGGPTYRAALSEGLAQAIAQGKDETDTLTGGEKLGAQVGLAIVETLGAHERVSLDARLGRDGAELELEVAFPETPATASLQSWVRAVSERRLPASFAQLPGDNDLALSFSGLGPDITRSLLKLLVTELFNDMSQEFALSTRELGELSESFRGLVPPDAHFSLEMGADLTAVEQALRSDAVVQADDAGRGLSPAAIKQLQAALGGWTTLAFDENPAEYMPAVERMLRANAIPMRRRPGMPRKTSEREDSKLRKRPLTTRGLPAGTLHLVDQIRPAKTYRPPLDGSEPAILPYDAHWLVVPDGKRVWIVMARSEALAGERALRAVHDAHRLAERSEIRRVAERPALAAWSFSLAGLRLQGLAFDSVAQRNAARAELSRFSSQLHAAKTPMLLTLEVAPRAANQAGFGLRAKLHASQAALTELVLTSMPALLSMP